jgi:hypothetical protein
MLLLTHHLKGHDRAKERSNESCKISSELRSALASGRGVDFEIGAPIKAVNRHFSKLGRSEIRSQCAGDPYQRKKALCPSRAVEQPYTSKLRALAPPGLSRDDGGGHVVWCS